jgi:flagellar basal body rod protein FlgB
MNSEGTNVETAVYRDERQTAYAEEIANRGTAAEHGNAPSTNTADYSNNDAPAAASVHNNHNTVQLQSQTTSAMQLTLML